MILGAKKLPTADTKLSSNPAIKNNLGLNLIIRTLIANPVTSCAALTVVLSCVVMPMATRAAASSANGPKNVKAISRVSKLSIPADNASRNITATYDGTNLLVALTGSLGS